MRNRLYAWLVHEDENMPDDLKLGNLDRLDGITTHEPTELEVAA